MAWRAARPVVNRARSVAFRALTVVTAPTIPREVRRTARSLGSRPCRVLAGDLRGAIFLNPIGQMSPAYCRGSFERHVSQVMHEHIRVGDVVFDVGASVGWHSLRMSKLVGHAGLVRSFEPSATDRAILERNLLVSAATNVVVDRRAVGRSVGVAEFALFKHPGVGHLARADTPTDAILSSVEVTCLDDVVRSGDLPGPTFIKIDVEGSELDVIEGATELIDTWRPALAVELRREETWAPVVDRMTQHGYTWRELRGDGQLADVVFTPSAT